MTGILMASPACGLPPLAAFKQSPPAVPALGTNVKKRRHGDEDVYYMHVSGCGVLRAGPWALQAAGGAPGEEAPSQPDCGDVTALLHPPSREGLLRRGRDADPSGDSASGSMES